MNPFQFLVLVRPWRQQSRQFLTDEALQQVQQAESAYAHSIDKLSQVAGPALDRSPSPLAGARVSSTDPSVHVFLWGNPATTARDLQLAKDGGFHWVKQRFEWRNIEGKSKGGFEWNEPDRIVDAISQTGLKIVARVDNQPQWAATSVQWPGTGPPDNPKDWSDFLGALAARYRGRIQAYEIWNEPNLDREWGGKKPDPNAYTSMLKASYQAIKAADPDALVVSAGPAGALTSSAFTPRVTKPSRAPIRARSR